MTKRVIAILLSACLLCALLCACRTEEKKEDITADQAWQIVLSDLGQLADQAQSPHIHTGTYGNQSCYNIFFDLKGESLMYAVSFSGKILHKGAASHSH